MKPTASHIILTLFAATSLPAGAVVLNIDFGPSAPTLTSNSPYHTVNPTAGTTWNLIGNGGEPVADPTGTLLYADGSTATGIGVNLGVNADITTTTLINLATQPGRSSALGGTFSSPGTIYSSGTPGRDGIFHGTSVNTATGIQITGLAAGIYEIYVAGRNTNVSTDYTQVFFAGTGTAGSNFNYSGYSTSTLSFTGTTAATTWTEGSNYVKFTVTLNGTDALNVLSSGAGRGFLNNLQIVPIPEPSSLLLLSSASLCLLRRRRIV